MILFRHTTANVTYSRCTIPISLSPISTVAPLYYCAWTDSMKPSLFSFLWIVLSFQRIFIQNLFFLSVRHKWCPRAAHVRPPCCPLLQSLPHFSFKIAGAHLQYVCNSCAKFQMLTCHSVLKTWKNSKFEKVIILWKKNNLATSSKQMQIFNISETSMHRFRLVP